MDNGLKKHWEDVYQNKKPNEVSWLQEIPKMSLEYIQQLNIPLSAKIIDIGGGDSYLAEHLLEKGYTNITVLDISENAINRAKQRLGAKANLIKWINTDIINFKPTNTYDLWHDRATFHFLTTQESINKYLLIVREAVKGKIVIGTFSSEGPTSCSGLKITQYNEPNLVEKFKSIGFRKNNCKIEEHITPSNTFQEFIFCAFSNA
jgi:uncharacterized UPF0146 family protein